MVIIDQSRFLKFVHEIIDPGASSAYHFRQDLVAGFRGYLDWLRSLLTKVSELEKKARQAFFAMIK